MFGRLIRVSIVDKQGNSIVLVDSVNRNYNDYRCKGTIDRFSGSQMDCLTLSIFNLDPVIRGELAVQTYNRVIVEFGYKDEGGILTTIFDGTIRRPQHKRTDVVTDETVIYAYDSGNFKTYGFYSKTYYDGANFYDIAQDVAKNGNVRISSALSEKLKNYKVKGSKSFYGSQDEILNDLAKESGLSYKTENNVARIFDKNEDLEDVIWFTREVENNSIVSASGLIGIPTLESDGLNIECLINPQIKIYSRIGVSNSIISVKQNGQTPNVEAGGQFNASGIYRITKMSIYFSNDGEQNSMTLKAVSNDLYSRSY